MARTIRSSINVKASRPRHWPVLFTRRLGLFESEDVVDDLAVHVVNGERELNISGANDAKIGFYLSEELTGGDGDDGFGGEVDPVSPVGIEDVAWVAVDDPSAAGAARRGAEQLARTLGLPGPRTAEIGLAVTEIARNIQRHGGGGTLLLRAVRVGLTGAVEVIAMDTGPGIRDLAAARLDGSSTRGTLGIGLGAIERLADTFEIVSAPGRGTILIAGFEADRRLAGNATPHGGGDHPPAGRRECAATPTRCGANGRCR